MKSIKSVVLLGLMLICGCAANAQTEGAKSTSFISKVTAGGYNQVNLSYVSQGFHTKYHYAEAIGGAMDGEDLDSQFNTASLQGFGVEYIRGFKVSKKLPMFVEAGINFNFTFGDEGGQPAQHIGFDIPISYAYKFNIKNKFTIKPYAGLDFKVGLLGKHKVAYDEEDDDAEWESWYDSEDEDGNDTSWKRFNLGWHLGADFQYKSYSVGLNFVSGITRVYTSKFYDVKNPFIAIKLGYTF